MLRLLVVDDEQIEREGMLAIIRDGFPDLVLEQAKNGKMAVELVPHFLPDLILMDIKMPGMNGLEAVENISIDYPDMRFIMVTAYDTFEYARKAIKLGVKDYLLKPSKVAEIRETVSRVLRQIEEERSVQQVRLSVKNTLERVMPVVEADVVTQLLFDHVHEVHLDEMVALLGGHMTGEVFVLIIQIDKETATEAFYMSVKVKMRQMANGWVGAMSGRQIPVIGFREEDKSFRAQAASMIRQLLELPQQATPAEYCIGVGNPRQSLDQIRFSYQEALQATSDISVPSKHRFYSDLLEASTNQSSEHASKLQEKQIMELVRLGQWEDVEEWIYSLIDRFRNSGMPIHQAQQRMLESVWIVFRGLMEMGVETELPYYSFLIGDYRALRTETECLYKRMREDGEQYRSRFHPDVILQVKQYIIEHSHLEISLETIAKQAALSPFYMSKMFKEQIGINYIDFLTECRVGKAKLLMGDAERSLKEIAYEVGYHDPNYFSKVFKKVCGVSPTEYRKAMIGGKA